LAIGSISIDDDQIGKPPMLVSSSGWSMAPFVKDGDRLVIAPVPANRLRIGDIIAYDDIDSSSIVCHRLVDIQRTPSGTHLFARGDASCTIEGPIAAVRLRGRIVAIYRRGCVTSLDGPLRVVLHRLIVRWHPLLCAARGIKQRLVALGSAISTISRDPTASLAGRSREGGRE